jgi:hypothetical protein
VLTAHISGNPGADVGLETTSSSLPADIPADSQVVVIDPKLSKKYPETYTISHVEYINKRVYYGVKGLNEIFLASQLAIVKPADKEKPSAEDLDAVAQEKAAAEATAGAEQTALDATGGQQGATEPDGGTFEPGSGAADTQ